MRRAAIEAGTWESTMVPADEAREHIKRLQAAGYTIKFIAHLARVDEQSVSRARSGKHGMVMLETKERVCAVPVRSLWTLWHTEDHPHRMPTGPVTRRIRSLIADGWTYSEVGDALGWTRSLPSRYANNPPKWTMSTLTRRVDEVYRSPEFAVPVRAPRADIIRNKWPRPFDWGNIDDPQAAQGAHNRAYARFQELC